MASGDLFSKNRLTISEWLTSKKWQDFKTEGDYSIIDIASFEYGNNFIKAKIMEMQIFKIF